MDVVALIQTLGFPVAVAIGLGWFILVMWKDQKKIDMKREEEVRLDNARREERLLKDFVEREEKLLESFNERQEKSDEQMERFADSIDKLNTTLENVDKRLTIVETRLIERR